MNIDEQHRSRVRNDPGLQPERTSMAWGRTTFAFLVASAIFLRWLPHYGVHVLVLVLVGASAAGIIFLTQYRRYRRHSGGLARERLHADPVAVTAITILTLALGGAGIWMILND